VGERRNTFTTKKKKENLLRLTTESERIWEEKKASRKCAFLSI
jgi:hypothetical protein